MSSPSLLLSAITLRSAASVPPIVALSEFGSRKIPVLLAPAVPSSFTPIQLSRATKLSDSLITLMPVSAPVTAKPSITTLSSSTCRPNPPDGPLTPAQGPLTPAAVAHCPAPSPSIVTGSVMIGKLAPRAIVSASSPLKAAANLIVSGVPTEALDS